VARYTRHQLKEDRFATAVQEQVHWAVAHRNKMIVAGAVLGLLVLAAFGAFFYNQSRNDQASVALSAALRLYDAPLRPASAPQQPGQVSFTKSAERAQAAQKEFRKVVQDYPYTRSADFARYFVGVAAMDMGDYKTAEDQLKELTGSRRDDLSALSKLALASVYRGAGKEAQAIPLYKDLIDHPSNTVPKSTAQLELAALYEKAQPTEASRIYEQIRKDEPNSIAAQYAGTRLQGGK